MDVSHHVFGVEGDIWFPNTVGGNQTFTTGAVGSATYSETVQFRAPPGQTWICGRQLAVLSTGGFAWSFDQFARTQISGAPAAGTAESQSLFPGTAERLALEPTLP